ncbi:GCN5-related N-acetyltransferase 6, chloroplastic [Rosa rugosa]|uniref:GCN5-related N-acetyltransferase 6, chloroplastic n=1 Tax=Rosa rugosa TaxID=74645 RepID=UPI002B404428|nr:GCN5-related N-acetyltransferase 6, chloroplastic [Rosa rugosa]XP_061996102.1 GCN5-related N-acetyltransferase 6, chloroplastic [Rosa rugosa]XP_061996111.1 GCN5-related N-acetyltransferase 6, chloroplastic [Rosa rugosa]XP_061996115.1 GCN5-related N-acetyltransferase 6, chloroplastic [Rosa rugosa]XP_061996123.1 GCN5-related N-acetyltransferase 6, chloroplastic [Rosa rugosa]
MMFTISVPKPGLVRFSHDGTRRPQKFDRTDFVWSMKMESKFSHDRKIEELSVELPTPPSPHPDSSRDRALQFNRGQPSGKDLDPDDVFEFGGYIAREGMCDEEYWTAAYLRAETRWEDRNHDRYVESHIRKYTEQEFNEIKRRSNVQFGKKCRCIVTMKKDSKNVKRTVLKSMVGTLDLRIRYLLNGETFPEEQVKPSIFSSFSMTRSNRYGYIANLCVIKPARRQGVARNMLQFAIKQAKLDELERVYVHVDRKNKNAQDLYEKMGFQIIESTNPQLEKDELYLLCLKI